MPRETSLNPLIFREIHQGLADGYEAEAAVFEAVGESWARVGNAWMAWKYRALSRSSRVLADEQRLLLLQGVSQ